MIIYVFYTHVRVLGSTNRKRESSSICLSLMMMTMAWIPLIDICYTRYMEINDLVSIKYVNSSYFLKTVMMFEKV